MLFRGTYIFLPKRNLELQRIQNLKRTTHVFRISVNSLAIKQYTLVVMWDLRCYAMTKYNKH